MLNERHLKHWTGSFSKYECLFFTFYQSMCRTTRSTVDGYFLAGKNMTWWPVS